MRYRKQTTKANYYNKHIVSEKKGVIDELAPIILTPVCHKQLRKLRARQVAEVRKL